jgi:hypothetical protein
MRQRLLRAGLIMSALLAAQVAGLAQTVQQNGSLRVTGQQGQAPVLQMNGKSYVDIEALVKLINGSLVFKGDQSLLTLPASCASTATAASPTSPAANSEFSKDFLKAGIEEMSVIREWRSALLNALQNGCAVTDDFVGGYRGQATANLRLVSIAISTDSDRSAYELLNNEFNNMQKLSDKILSARQNLNYISRDALKGDPLDQQVLNCARSLAAMAANGHFQDDGACN